MAKAPGATIARVQRKRSRGAAWLVAAGVAAGGLPAPGLAGLAPVCEGTEEQAFAFTGAVQTFQVPMFVTRVTIDAAGAAGGSAIGPFVGGNGARLVATLSVSPGEILSVVVGGTGTGLQISGGGGGGSFVYRTADLSGLLVAAAGGGGGTVNGSGGAGSATTAAGDGGSGPTVTGGAGGTAGSGGEAGTGPGCHGAGGGGLITDGEGTTGGLVKGGKSLANGGAGGSSSLGGSGGFGGGGGACLLAGPGAFFGGGGGGGGGFNGGGGGAFSIPGDFAGAGGGGGSFNAVAPTFSQSGAQPGNGQVRLCFTPNVAPSIAKSFTPSSVPFGGTSTMSFTITNPNAVALTGLAFSDTFPAGLVVASPPAVADTCGFASGLPVAGATSFSVGGGTVAASTSCIFEVHATAATPGALINSSSGVSSSEAPTGVGSNIVALTVAAPTIADIPTVSRLGLGLGALLLAALAVRGLRAS